MANANRSTSQEIHQKPAAGVVKHILGSEQKRSKDPQIQKLSYEGIAILIDSLADEINENDQQIPVCLVPSMKRLSR